MKKWPVVLGIVVVILIIIAIFFYYVLSSPSEPGSGGKLENPIKGLTAEEAVLQFNEEYINYLVFAIGGWKLHNPPFSSNTPKIEVVVDDDIFVSEIIEGRIKTEKKEIDNEDLVVRTTKQEIVNSILSLDMKSYIKQSVEEGRTSLELKAGYTTALSKGYLNIYKDMTGEKFTG